MNNRVFNTHGGSHWRFHENTPQSVRDPASISPMRFIYLPIAFLVFLLGLLALMPFLLLSRSRKP